MSMRAFRPGVLPRCFPIVSALFLGALLLASCDSGADFSSLDDLSLNGDTITKAKVWYEEQTYIAASDNLSKISGDDDSLASAAFVEKFPPDWDKAVMLSGKEGEPSMVTTLGQYTDEKYDTTMHHVRTILFDLDASGKVRSGVIVVFSSRNELSKDAFDIYAKQYLEKDFGKVEMIVSRYTTRSEAIDAFLYRSGQIPLELSMALTKKEASSSGKLGSQPGKLGASFSITESSTICYQYCGTVYGTQCVYAGDLPPVCTEVAEIWCSRYCFDLGGGGGGGGGGGSDGGSDGDGEEEECACSAQEQCDLADEYSSGQFTCSDFSNNHGNMVVYGPGTENGKHGSYGYIHSDLPTLYNEVRSFIVSQGVYDQIGINSGYRCPKGNANVPGSASNSRHKWGKALDIQIYSSSVWTETLKQSIVDFNKNVRPGSDSYKGKHVHISV